MPAPFDSALDRLDRRHDGRGPEGARARARWGAAAWGRAQARAESAFCDRCARTLTTAIAHQQRASRPAPAPAPTPVLAADLLACRAAGLAWWARAESFQSTSRRQPRAGRAAEMRRARLPSSRGQL